MHTTEDPGEPWVAGPIATIPEWWNDVPGVQEAGSTPETPSGPNLDATPEDGVSSGDGGLSAAVQGFAAKEWVPKKYQLRGIQWLLKPAAALFLPPGLGKSSISLAAICKLKELGIEHRTLLLAPLMVCRTTWDTEPKKWGQFQGLKIGLAHGPDKKLILLDPYYDIVVMNYDGLEWAAPMLAQGHPFSVLLCDEITRLKNTSSKRYKLIKPLLGSFLFRWGLTGTPTANGLMDLFGQVYVLDLGQRLGKFITHFRLKYFHQQPYDKYRYFISQEKAKQLTDTLLDLAMYVDPEEWLELPDFLVIEKPVELRAESRGQYKFLEDEFMLSLPAGDITAANAGVLTSKLRQFVGGAMYVNPPEYSEVDIAKLDALDDLIEELAGEPLMVSYQFDHERERILKRHPSALALKGGMSKNQVTHVVDTWNSGQAPLLLVQPAAAALGLNLQFGGAAICWFTLTYNLEEYIQLNKRLHRQGQVQAVRCYLLSMQDTIDQRVAKVLKQKDIVQEDVFRALKLKM